MSARAPGAGRDPGSRRLQRPRRSAHPHRVLHIWRADAHGIGTYNQVLAAFGLPLITDHPVTHGFDPITTAPTVQARPLQAHTGPTREDFLPNGYFAGGTNPFVAGMAEDHVPGSDLGPLFHAVPVDPFTRLRDGDRCFYQQLQLQSGRAHPLRPGLGAGGGHRAQHRHHERAGRRVPLPGTQDGKAKGYYANTNGRADLTGSPTGTQLTTALRAAPVAALNNPDHAGCTGLVDAAGSYVSANALRSYSYVTNFPQNPALTNVANKLSLPLLTTEFNILLGKVDVNSSIHVPPVTLPPVRTAT